MANAWDNLPDAPTTELNAWDSLPDAPTNEWDSLPDATVDKSVESSALGAGLRSAAANVVPTATGLLGGMGVGALGGAVAGPVGAVIGGISGALAGGFGGNKLQETVAPKVLGEQRFANIQAQLSADEEQHPYATLAGSFIPQAMVMSPSPSGIGKALKATDILKKATLEEIKSGKHAADINNLVNVYTGLGLGTGMEGYNQLQSGNFDALKLAISAGGGALLNKPRFGGKVPLPESPEAIAAQTAKDTALKTAAEADIQPVVRSPIDNQPITPIESIGTATEVGTPTGEIPITPTPEPTVAPEGVPLGKATIDTSKLQENLDAGMNMKDAREAARVTPEATPITEDPTLTGAPLKGNIGASGSTTAEAKVSEALGDVTQAISDISGNKPIPSAIPMSKRTLSDHIKIETDRARQEGLSNLDQTLTGLKSGWNYMKELMTQPPRDDGLSQATARHGGAYNQIEEKAKQFWRNNVKIIGNEDTLAAISVYADAGGDPAILAKGLAEAPMGGRKAYENATKLNAKEQDVARQLKILMDNVGGELASRDLLKLAQQNYFRRIFKIKDETTLAAVMNRFLRGKNQEQPGTPEGLVDIDKSVGSIGKERKFTYDFEAMKFAEQLSKEAGIKIEVEPNAFKRTLNYWMTASKTLADIKLIDEMRISRQKRDGKLSIITQEDLNRFQTIGSKIDGLSPHENFVKYIDDLKAEVKARDKTLSEIIATKNEQSRNGAEAKLAESQAKLAKAKGLYDIHKGANGKTENFVEPNLKDYSQKVYDGLGQVWIHPDALPQVRSIFELSSIRKNAALKISSEFKQSMLSMSMFHPVQLAIHGIEHRVNPFNLVKELDFSGNTRASENMTKLSDAGLVHSATEELANIMEGVSGGGGLYSKIPGLGKILGSANRWIFEDFHPRLKMTMALHALERNRARYAKDLASGKMSDFQLHRLTAEQANAAFGGLNYKLLGRSPTFQDGLRLALLAPDFLEARARFAGQALTKYGGEQRAALALGAATLYVAARILNLMISGRPHFEKENMFSVVADGKSWSLRTLQGDILHAVSKPGQFVLGRVNPLMVKPVIEATTGRDFFGRQRTKSQQAKDLITTAVPISLRGFLPDQKREEGIAQIFGSAFGFGAKRFQESNEIYKKAGEWKIANNIQSRGEFIYEPDKDPYRSIKLALSDGDTASAIADIRAFLQLPQVGPVPKSEAQKMEILTNHFYKYSNSPFTGSLLNEFYFVKSLSPEDKQAYKEAKAEKGQIFKEFIKARNTYLSERNKPYNIAS